MYSQENGDGLVKPSDIKNAKMHQGKNPVNGLFFYTAQKNIEGEQQLSNHNFE